MKPDISVLRYKKSQIAVSPTADADSVKETVPNINLRNVGY